MTFIPRAWAFGDDVTPASMTDLEQRVYTGAVTDLRSNDVKSNLGTGQQTTLGKLASKPAVYFGTFTDQYDLCGFWQEDAGTIKTNTFFEFSGSLQTSALSFDGDASTVSADSGRIEVNGGLRMTGPPGFNGTTPPAKPTVTGSRGSNAALASLLTALASTGLITDSSS